MRRAHIANISEALTKGDSANAKFYKARAKSYLKKLDKSEIAKIPQERLRVIASHDAFQYYGEAYKVEFIAPLGISIDSQPSTSTIVRLIDQIRI